MGFGDTLRDTGSAGSDSGSLTVSSNSGSTNNEDLVIPIPGMIMLKSGDNSNVVFTCEDNTEGAVIKVDVYYV